MHRQRPVAIRPLLLVGLALVLSLLGLPLVPATPLLRVEPAGAAGAGQVLTDRVAYGPNEAVRAMGTIVFTQGCKTHPEHVGKGVDDIFQPWADLYVVPRGSVTAGGSLQDISGDPNVIFGGLAGGFVEEVIGYTGPSGKIPAGIYDIVLDECQDGVFDAEDALVVEAFRVTVPLGTAPATIGGPDKERAAELAGTYGDLAKVWDALLKAVSKKTVGGTSIGFASDFSIGLFQVLTQTALPDPRPAASAALVQMGRRQAGLAADPPDADFHEHAGFDAGAPIGPGITGDPLEDAVVAAAREQAIDSALLAALVRAVERHQGAAEVGNGDWMAAHARDALEIIDAIEARATRSPSALLAVGDEYVAQIFAIRTHVDQIVNRHRDYMHGGDPYKDHRNSGNRGTARAELDAVMVELAALEDAKRIFGNLGGAAFRTNLQSIAADVEAQLLGFGDLRTSLEASLVSLADEGRDAPRPTADAGGPYTTDLGAPLVLDATASAGSNAPDATSTVVAWAWDLDLDGTFDDATGAEPTFTGDQPGSRLVAVQVTDDRGATDVALATVEVTRADLAPVLTSVTPMPSVVEGEPGAAFELSVTAEDPEGEPVAIEWLRDGAVVGTGTALTGTSPSPWGTDRYDAFATDPAGNLVVQTFFVTGWGPDGDGDGWRVPVDCDDTDADVRPDVYPGEIVGNGLDDDCDPTTADDAQAPRISIFAVSQSLTPTGGYQEGDVMVMSTTWNHPNRYSGEPFEWSVDWGDGTVTTGTVAGTTYAQTQLFPEHVYRSDGRKSATLCITAPGGLTDCLGNDDLIYRTPVLPAPPVVHPANVEEWTNYDIGRAGDPYAGGTSNWYIAPGGFSGIQTTNRNLPNVLLSPFELDTSTTGSARIAFEMGTAGNDDDNIGLTLGLDHDEAEQDDADWLMVQISGHLGTFSASLCGGSGGTHTFQPDPAMLLRVHGYPHWLEWAGAIFDVPDATDPLCRDDMGTEVLDSLRLPQPPGQPSTGVWRRLVHPAYVTAPASQIDHLYHVEVEYSPAEVTVWMDGIEVLHATAPPDDPFPMGRVGLLSASQPFTRLIGHTQVPIEQALQGQLRDFSAAFADADLVGSHTAVIDWGDGTPSTQATIQEVPDEPGFWTVTAPHAYASVGLHHGEVCVTDTEDHQVGCGTLSVVVSNAAPVVDAGRDVVTVGSVSLAGATYSDPGAADTHTATIDWGDGTPLEDAAIDGRPGSGVIHGAHTYGDPGTYVVEVCATDAPRLGALPRPGDEDGLTGCDDFEVEVTAPVTPTAQLAEEVTGEEGTPVEVGVGFADGAPGQRHVVRIDWGDGTPEETVAIVDVGRAGIGWPTHVWREDGDYEVTATVCVVDDENRCDDITRTVAVDNAAPVVDEPMALSEAGGEHTLTGEFTDPGVDDTHTATIDWGDGAGPVPAVVAADGQGGGSVTASHRFATSGSSTVILCVTDDAGAVGCAQAGAEVTAPPGPPLEVSAVGGDASARVRWDPPTNDGGAPITGYEIETTPGLALVPVPSSPTLAEVTGLTNGLDHTFRVRAANAHGWGPWSTPSNVARPRAACTGAAFPDVGPAHPFCPEITWMADEGLSSGYPDGSYLPAVPTTRQAMAAFLYRLSGSEPDPACTVAPFTDVAVGHAFCGEIAWMREAGISTGFADGTFHPDRPISRQAMAAFLQRIVEGEGGGDPTCTNDQFSDVDAGHQFCGVIRWMVGTGITGGYDDGSFKPAERVSRQAMAAFVFRFAILTSRSSVRSGP